MSNIAASTQAAGVSSAAFQTANTGVVTWGSPVGNVLVTQFFDASSVLPSLSFTLDSAFDHLSLSFKTWHNHTAS